MDSRAEPADVDRDGDRPRVRPQAVFAELSRQLPDRAVLSSDSGSAANWYARHIRMRTGMKGTLSGSLATMVPGMAYTIAAKFAYPDRVAVGTIGDGAMQMGGMAELITAAKYYRDWDDPRMVVVVLNNEDLNQVTWEQRAMAGDPKFDASQDLPYVPYAAFAELIGLRGIKVDRSAQLADAFEEAFAADRPVIVDVMTDPEEPPIPPHITFAQFEALTTSVLADPKEGVAGAVNAAREFAEGILPRR
nr:thiamine pyrophosphate-dependent enzyme [Pseudactinotalea sp. HY160]